MNPIRWWFYILSLDGPAATARQLLYAAGRRWVRETPYVHGPAAGYVSYLRLGPVLLAFRRTDTALQFYW